MNASEVMNSVIPHRSLRAECESENVIDTAVLFCLFPASGLAQQNLSPWRVAYKSDTPRCNDISVLQFQILSRTLLGELLQTSYTSVRQQRFPLTFEAVVVVVVVAVTPQSLVYPHEAAGRGEFFQSSESLEFCPSSGILNN
jgi:hypothetical protein